MQNVIINKGGKMDFLKQIKDNSIIIAESDMRDEILDFFLETDEVLNIKLMNFDEIKKGLLFDYDSETINFVMKKYSVNYDIAKDYIDSTYLLSEDNLSSSKGTFLNNLKTDLIDNNLLIFDHLFPALLKNYDTVYVVGYHYLDSFNKYLLELVKPYLKVEIIDVFNNNYQHQVYEAQNIEEEICFIAEKISSLLKNDVPINKIYIANYSNEYTFNMMRIFKDYGIPLTIPSSASLFDTAIGEYFIKNIDDDLDTLMSNIEKKFEIEENRENRNIYQLLINLLNRYYWTNNIGEIKDLIVEEMKKVRIPTLHKEKEVQIVNFLNRIFGDDEYVFLIGFNLNVIPAVKRDEDFIQDSLKPKFKDTSSEYNTMMKDAYIKAISNIKNLTITYKLTTAFESYLPSYLIEELKMPVIRDIFKYSNFSNNINMLLLAKRIDNLIKYNEQDDTLHILGSNYQIPYKEYDNKFKGVDSNIICNRINDKISFSYSNISTYYECPYKFFLNNIYNLNDFIPSFDQFIGSLFHHILEIGLIDDIDIDKEYENFIQKEQRILSNKEKFFLDKLKEVSIFVIETIREQYKHTLHNSTSFEQRCEIVIDNPIKTKIKGFVDKIIQYDNDALIVDYKTNQSKVNCDLFEFGLNLQLPIYLYLLKKTAPKVNVVGLYLQHIIPSKKYNLNDPEARSNARKDLKLDGLTFNDLSKIRLFDDTYENSQLIKGLKIDKKTNALKENKNLLSLEEKEKLENLVENLIYDCIRNVCNAHFDINPIKIPGTFDACEYCKYKDICFRQYKDIKFKTINKEEGENECQD